MARILPPDDVGAARRVLAALIMVVGTLVWTHAAAGALRAMAGIPVAELAPASVALTLGSIATALVAASGLHSRRLAVSLGAAAGVASVAVVALVEPAARVPAMGMLPVAVVFAWMGGWLARRLPASLDALPVRRRKSTALWLLVAVVAVVQLARLSTYITDHEADWFLSTRNPFYAKHECANAYIYAAELHQRGESNVYEPSLYPGLNPQAQVTTSMRGMVPEDPYQYPPQFLLLPQLVVSVTHDYGAFRSVWFGFNITLCLGAMLALAVWVGGRAGAIAGWSTPAVLASFPVLHDFQYGQFHFAAVALAVLGLLAMQLRRPRLGGFLLAASILAKLFPALLLVPLVVQRRWRDLAWTAAAATAITLLALLSLGTAPFVAFFEFHLPRMMNGSAFAFGEAWPELAQLLTADNQGIHGIVHKLAAMGLPGVEPGFAPAVGRLFSLALLAVAALTARRSSGVSRAVIAVGWLALLGLGSLASAGAWGDYVPLTCVWMLAFLLPMARSPAARALLAVCAVMQVTLLGAVPLGDASDASWMLPVSLFGALSMLWAFAAGLWIRVPESVPTGK